MQLTREQLEFLARFARTPDGKMLSEIYRAKLVEADGKLRTADGEDIYRQQGRAQQLSELLTEIAEAQQKLVRTQAAPVHRSPFQGA